MRALVLCFALGAAVPGQRQFTSPPGVGADGDSVVSSLQPFHAAANGRRFQYVVDDARHLPGMAGESISAIALRPDPGAPASAARTATVDLVVDHTEFATLSTAFAANYSGSETTYALGTVSLPATTGSSGFAIAFPLSAPFVYFGVHHPTRPTRTALLVEFRTTAVTGGTFYSLDCADGTLAPSVGTASYLGLQPCVVPPNAGGFDVVKHPPSTAGGQTAIAWHALRGPASAFGILAIGLTDPDTDYGGLLCAPQRASLDVVLPVTTDGQGSIGSFANPIRLTFPDLRAGQTLRAFSQFVVYDPARAAPQAAVSLSDAVQLDLTAPRTVDRRLLYATTAANAATGTLTEQFVPVFRFN